MASEYTSNYKLDLYTDADKPNLRDQYNAAMNKIDAALVADDASLSTMNGQLVTMNNTVTAMNTTVQAHTTEINSLQDEVAENTGDIADQATLIQNNQQSIQALNTRCDDTGTAVNDLADALTEVKTTVGDANSGLVKRVTDLENETEEKPVFVIFGDSWSDFGTFQNWFIMSCLSDILQCEMKNFAVGGAGFTGGSSRVSQQVSTASGSMTGIEKSNAKWVVLTAGVNDINPDLSVTYTAWKNAVSDVITAIHSLLPNAQIVFAPTIASFNYGSSRSQNCALHYWNLMKDLASVYPYLRFTPNAPYYWVGYANSECYNSDNLHLNANGARLYAKDISDAILGSNCSRRESYWYTSGLYFFYDSAGNCDVHGSITWPTGSNDILNSANHFTEAIHTFVKIKGQFTKMLTNGNANYFAWLRSPTANSIISTNRDGTTYYC